MAICNNYYHTLYKCPVVQLRGYCKKYRLDAEILAYLDFGGPTGTAKDGLAEMLLALAVQQGRLAPGQTVVEAGSGHFARALAVATSVAGFPCVLAVSPELPEASRRPLQALGARLVAAPTADLRGQLAFARQYAQKSKACFLGAFEDPQAVQYHKRVTGPNLLKAVGESIDAVVVGVGSGATITGVGEYVRQWQGLTRIVAVEPAESQALAGGLLVRHQIDGLGCGFVPELYNPYVVNDVLAVSSAAARRTAREVLLSDGIPASISAGAVLEAARQLILQKKARRPVCIFAGRGEPPL